MSPAKVEAVLWVTVSALGGLAAGLLGAWLMPHRPPLADNPDLDGNENLARVEAELDEDGPISGERGEWP